MPGPQVLPETTLPSVLLLDMAAVEVAQTKPMVHRLHKVLVEIYTVLVAAADIRIQISLTPSRDFTLLQTTPTEDYSQVELLLEKTEGSAVMVEVIMRQLAAAAALEPLVAQAQRLLVHLPKLVAVVERDLQV
jgi:hypothetical protein